MKCHRHGIGVTQQRRNIEVTCNFPFPAQGHIHSINLCRACIQEFEPDIIVEQ